MLSIFAEALLIATRMDSRNDHRNRRLDRDADARRNREHMMITNVRF